MPGSAGRFGDGNKALSQYWIHSAPIKNEDVFMTESTETLGFAFRKLVEALQNGSC
jgi:hypothetical protein